MVAPIAGMASSPTGASTIAMPTTVGIVTTATRRR
jgi:hypothetical protein